MLHDYHAIARRLTSCSVEDIGIVPLFVLCINTRQLLALCTHCSMQELEWQENIVMSKSDNQGYFSTYLLKEIRCCTNSAFFIFNNIPHIFRLKLKHTLQKLDYINSVQLSVTLGVLSITMWWLFDRTVSGLVVGLISTVVFISVSQFFVYHGFAR